MGPYGVGSATAICLAQTPAAAGPLILNGATVANGVATLDDARNVLITTTADERGRTFTIEGRDWRGDRIGEVIQGVNTGTALSVNNYLTITAARISGPPAGAVSVGTSGTIYSPWVRLDDYGGAFLNYSIEVTGAVTYTVQQSYDDPNSPTNPVAPAAMNWQPSSIAALVGASTTQQGAYGSVPPWLRVQFASGGGSLTATFLQPG
jgi:hypothetical protein